MPQKKGIIYIRILQVKDSQLLSEVIIILYKYNFAARLKTHTQTNKQLNCLQSDTLGGDTSASSSQGYKPMQSNIDRGGRLCTRFHVITTHRPKIRTHFGRDSGSFCIWKQWLILVHSLTRRVRSPSQAFSNKRDALRYSVLLTTGASSPPAFVSNPCPCTFTETHSKPPQHGNWSQGNTIKN